MPVRGSRVALVAEDEPILLLELVERLQEFGVQPLEALSVDRALNFVQSSEHLDLLITDIRLGGSKDGWEIAELARKLHPEVKVIYISANDPIEEKMVEGSVFLRKPADWEVVADKVQRMLAE